MKAIKVVRLYDGFRDEIYDHATSDAVDRTKELRRLGYKVTLRRFTGKDAVKNVWLDIVYIKNADKNLPEIEVGRNI